jgi:hypothetical protein
VVRDGWRLIRDGDGGGDDDGGAVLCVDFTQARVRAQAGFVDLAALLPAGPRVWGSDERSWRDATAPPAWLDGAPDPGARSVLAFCAGAALACALARHLGERTGAPPRVVLFDPTVATGRTLHEQFEASVAGVARGADADEVARARDGARRDLDAEPDPARLGALLVRRYAALAEPACAAQGVPAAIAAQLCERFATHLRYLALAASTPLEPPPGALAVLSAEHRPPPLGPATPLRVDAAAPALLADPRAAAAAAGAVAPGARPEPAGP